MKREIGEPGDAGADAGDVSSDAGADAGDASSVAGDASAEADASATAASADAEPAASGGRRRRSVLIGAGAAAAVLIAVVAGVARRGCGADRGGGSAIAGDPMTGLVEAWRADGLEPGSFAPVPGDDFGGGVCRRGTVSQLDVVVCLHPTARDALAARRTGMRAIGGEARSAISSGRRLLLAATHGSDSPRALQKVTRSFQNAPPMAGDAAGPRGPRSAPR